MNYLASDEVNHLNRQVYLLEQKVDIMQQILQNFRDALYYSEPINGNDLIRPVFLKSINQSLNELEVILDA